MAIVLPRASTKIGANVMMKSTVNEQMSLGGIWPHHLYENITRKKQRRSSPGTFGSSPLTESDRILIPR